MTYEYEQRLRVVTEARKWIGTPFHHGADLPGVGVDCGMLIVRSFVDTGLAAPFDPRPYPADWHLHRREERYLDFVRERCVEMSGDSAPRPGDIILFRFGRTYSHGGIVTGDAPLTIVHAFWPARAVIEEELGHNIQLCAPHRPWRVFSFWEGKSR